MSHSWGLKRPSHDQVVQRIYDAADEPQGFDALLPELTRYVNGRSVLERAQTFVTAHGALTAHHHTGLDTGRFDLYLTHWQDKDPRMAAATARPGVVLNDTVDIDRSAFERSAIFNEALAVDDSYYSIFGIFPISDELVLAQALLRGRADGPFGESEVARMTALVPHLSRVVYLRHLIHEIQRDRDDLRLALDALPIAVAIVGHSGGVICANAAATTLLDGRDGVRVERGRLTASKPSDAAALAAAIAKAAVVSDATTTAPAPAALVPSTALIARDDRRPLVVHCLPLRPRSSIRERDARAARVLVVLHDPDRKTRLDPALVERLFGLTPTEALLAVTLAEGRPLLDFARDRGCTEQTARTHLKRVLEKTGAKRQAELVRLILLGAAAHVSK